MGEASCSLANKVVVFFVFFLNSLCIPYLFGSLVSRRKHCISRWVGSLRAVSSESTLFASYLFWSVGLKGLVISRVPKWVERYWRAIELKSFSYAETVHHDNFLGRNVLIRIIQDRKVRGRTVRALFGYMDFKEPTILLNRCIRKFHYAVFKLLHSLIRAISVLWYIL